MLHVVAAVVRTVLVVVAEEEDSDWLAARAEVAEFHHRGVAVGADVGGVAAAAAGEHGTGRTAAGCICKAKE